MANDSDGWVQIRHFSNRTEAEQYALVLIAMQINCRLSGGDWGIGLSVAVRDEARARRELAQYAAENRARPAAPAGPTYPLTEGVDGAIAYAAVMIIIAAAAERFWFGADWLPAGAAHAGLILGGEWWRAITALGLHGDFGHLIANLASGSLIGLALAQVIGGGLAWLSILLAGGIGNFANAVFQPADHVSIGASTAIFGGLGVLSTLAWRRRAIGLNRGGLRSIAPLVAGATLLGFLGSGGGQDNIDVAGHLAGFLVGGAIGFAVHVLADRLPASPRAQLGYGALAFAIFAGAWTIALA
ncbi:MAG: rhomboid family intramembrane serine protease [Bauldia sp.]|nr:rhomboid family intramembrane serine protease [Bauldia sp.]